MEFFVEKISSYPDTDYLKILGELPRPEQEYIMAKKTNDERKRSLLCRYLLKKNTGCNLKNIVRGKYGKPYIPGMFFNFSHSSDYVAVAISGKEVGINIITRKSGDYNYIYSFTTPEEREYINYNDYRYCDIYIQKRAYVKCIGIGNKNLTKYNILSLKDVTMLKRITDNYSLAVCELGD